MDDVDRIEELRGYVHAQPNSGNEGQKIIYALLSSTVYIGVLPFGKFLDDYMH
ncbi:MAG: hypothetical protein Q9173_001795 [Seirophora scorigena]